ncbi:hypothetical protein QAD02_000786 [Eretmocerus hayati]|uniref:Uncharacterized protein n=1 Tax=Eretmocerus hayati TaxID=131215 RepID=A0ACC2NEE1_9HYME|nr:hypothetical protein QAD02_000786 [Eretmocerus hayati]
MEHSLNCFLCHNQIGGGINGLSSHLRRFHHLVLGDGIPDTGFVCAQNGCQQSFIDFYNLRRHLRDYHIVPDVPMQENEETLHAVENDRVEIQEERNRNPVQEPLAAANAVQDRLQPVDAVQGLLPPNRQNLIQDTANSDRDLGLKPTVVNAAIHFDSPFVGLKSLPQQMDALQKYCRMIKSRGIPLGKRLDSVYDKTTSSYVSDLVTESFQYVSAIEILELVLSSPEVREAIESEEPSEAGMYGSFLDGAHYAQHPFLQIYKRALRLKIYVDDLEIVGPLGSKTGVHKLTVFYLQIDDLPSHMNSELSSIHVLIICSSEDVKKYGYGKILAPFLDDLKKLESDEGVQILIDDEIYVLRATVIALCGDGLAIHEVYALLSPSSNKFCRMCMYSREDLHNASLERAPERTEDLFNQHYDLLRESNYSQEVKTLTGVNGESSFTSRFFHISRNKIFDLMHEFLEGICPMTIKAVLHQYVIIEKRINIQEVNDRIYSFNYGYVEQKNKPSANFTVQMLTRDGHGLSQKAMQMWLLTRAFPFIFADKAEEQDQFMGLVLELNKIMEIVFAPRVPQSVLPYLESITDEFRLSFKECFPHIVWINRMHQIGHLAECIEFSGSLIDFYCMRFEAKHGEIKLRAQNVHNFINPPKTLIRVSQCVQSSVWGAGDVQVQRIKAPSGTFKLVGGLLSKEYLMSSFGFVQDDEVFVPNTVAVNGTEYRTGLFVVIEKASQRDDNLPLFGRIEEIVLIQQARKEVFFLTSICTTLHLDTSVNAYRLELNDVRNSTRFIEARNLATYKAYDTWMRPDADFLFLNLRNIIE